MPSKLPPEIPPEYANMLIFQEKTQDWAPGVRIFSSNVAVIGGYIKFKGNLAGRSVVWRLCCLTEFLHQQFRIKLLLGLNRNFCIPDSKNSKNYFRKFAGGNQSPPQQL
jgi:hypothetical protein